MELVLKNLTYGYDDLLFDNFNIKFGSKLNHLIGPNGCGKSTLLKIISGKIKFDGQIYIDSKLVNQTYLEENSVLVNNDVYLFENKSVKHNILEMTNALDINIIKDFGFEDKLDENVSNLSGGYKKKLMLLIAFLIKPKILLLDEYSNYLDNEFVKVINEYIENYPSDKMIIYVDHNESIGTKEYSLENKEIDLVSNGYLKGKYKFKFVTTRFKLFSNILLFFLTFITSVLFLLNSIDFNKIKLNYYQNNNIWLMDNVNNNETGDYFYFNLRQNINFSGITYNERFDFKFIDALDSEEPNKCYVFENNKNLLGTKVVYNDTTYFVSGIIDLDTSLIKDDIVKSIVVNSSLKRGNCYLNIRNMNNDDILKNMRDNNSYFDKNIVKSSFIVSISLLLVYFILYLYFVSNDSNKKMNIICNYKVSHRNYFINDMLSNGLIMIIGFAILYYPESLIASFIYDKLYNFFKLNGLYNYVIFILDIIILFIYFICFPIGFVCKKQKNNCD